MHACIPTWHCCGPWPRQCEPTAQRRAPLPRCVHVLPGVCVCADPSDRVALQLSLLLTNIARFDFPGRAENLLQARRGAIAWDAMAWGGLCPGWGGSIAFTGAAVLHEQCHG